jgi:hypothetical protein
MCVYVCVLSLLQYNIFILHVSLAVLPSFPPFLLL